MTGRVPSAGAAADPRPQPALPSPLGPIPPPPPLSPLRRDHVPQPPALTTSTSCSPYRGPITAGEAGYNHMPNSTTSLSGPFSVSNSSHYASSEYGSRDVSPMALRNPWGSNGPYNPSEWGLVSGGSPQLPGGQFVQAQRPNTQVQPNPHADYDGSTQPPPPPYSAQPQPFQANTSSTRDTMSLGNATCRYSSSATAAATVSTADVPGSRPRNLRPLSMIQPSEMKTAFRQSGYFAPPPPPQSNPGSRSSSQTPGESSRSSLSFTTLFGRNRHCSGTESSCAPDILTQDHSATPGCPPPAPPEELGQPPASRRSTSAGPVGTSSCSSNNMSPPESRPRSPLVNTSWEPGMPLPGPPPGPPPSASRSQSLDAVGDERSRFMLHPAPRPKTRKAPQHGTQLGPIPTTPAGWVDHQPLLSPIRQRGLHIDTTNLSSKVNLPAEVVAESSSSALLSSSCSAPGAGLFRSSALRESIGAGIKERRSANRAARTSATDELSAVSWSSNPWADALAVKPAALDLRGAQGSSQRLPDALGSETDSVTPRSAIPQVTQYSDSPSGSTPKPGGAQLKISLEHTPPFSPGDESKLAPPPKDELAAIPPKALPTPPPQGKSFHYLLPSLSGTEMQDRPISHVLRLSSDISTAEVPLSPKGLSPRQNGHVHEDDEAFVQDSLKRHQKFLERERNAANDEERLHIFSDYILAESRLRRRRYSTAWASGNFDVRPVRERLFEQNVHTSRRWNGLQKTISTPPDDPTSPIGPRDFQSQWDAPYHPVLSPIASMSNQDEMSSRGRTSSRWWESHAGSEGEGMGHRVERSRRESKYMGLPKELREAMQQANSQTSGGHDSAAQDSSVDVYPNEKANQEMFGFYDDEDPVPVPHAPAEPRKLDVSRLVTLPPPYPRHYPAVNNSHPDLLSFRTVVRSISDFDEVAARRKRFKANAEALRKDTEQKKLEARRTFRSTVHCQLDEGSISFAEAAEAESALKVEEHEQEKQQVQAEFDSFQDVVLNPLHEILNERIAQTNSCIEELTNKILSEAQSVDPNQAQEEGDEQPELLEKLTQLKWLFEARESLHRELFGLLSERNAAFKAVVLLPYQQAGNSKKICDTKVFFAEDEHDRRAAFENEALARHQSFLQIVENNVLRGVEMQLSAFWDIAPSLRDILQQIPENIREFEGVEIPGNEFQENPSYYEHPLQYLYTLLSHAERSTYQFIESQTNLLCLLHEAKLGVAIADYKLQEIERLPVGVDTDEAERVRANIASARNKQEQVLTAELKDKVSMVEEHWVEGLGSYLLSTKERIKTALIEEGGWEDLEQGE